MKIVYLALFSLLLGGCASAPPRPTSVAKNDYASTKEYIAKLIQYEMKKHAIAGVSIALVDDQQIIWSEGFGFANQENKIPATAETLYRVGSISKLFTATAAMQLVEQSKLDIDQPLKTYIPKFSIKSRYPNSEQITPRTLMTHHSGLPRDWLKGFFTSQPLPFTELVDEIQDDYTIYPPNLIFSYSNLGISLLGNAIQNQSGMPFADYMWQSLLAPLDMKHSSFELGLTDSALMAKGYRGLESEIEIPLRDVPAGGLNSSVNDLTHFISMMFADGAANHLQIIQRRTLAEMLRPQNTAVALDFNSSQIGLGWLLNTKGMPELKNAGTVAWHSGATILFRGHLLILPEHKLGVVVLSNSSTSGIAIARISTQALALALEAKTGTRQPEAAPPAKTQPDKTPLTQAEISALAGEYTTLVGSAQVRTCGDGLCLQAANRNLDLIRDDDGLFRPHYSLIGIIPIDLGDLGKAGLSRRVVAGREVLVSRSGDYESLAGQRVELSSNIDVWKKRLGEYEIVNLGNDYGFINRLRLSEERGFLHIEYASEHSPDWSWRILLKPESDTEGVLLKLLNDGGHTLRVVMVNGEERMQYSGYQFKKVVQ